MVPGQEVVAGMGSGSSASPLSTGGAGTIFEYRVGALALAAVLRGDRFEALGVPVTQVGFQQNASGHYLDDFVVEGLGGDGLLLAEFQVKRRVVPVPSDRQWRSVITQCVAALDADEAGLASRRHFLGLASGGPARQLGDLRELTRWARTHPTVESLRELIVASGAIPARVRERWRYLSETVGQVLADSRGPVTGDEAEAVAFRIASALRVWVVEVEEGERDYRNALDRLGDLLTPGAADAAVGLFLQLADIAQELGSRAGRINARGLRDELARRGVPLIPVSRAALAAASMNLPLRNAAFTGRDGLLDQLALQLRGNEPAVVAAHGLGGVGKSQLVLEYAHRHRGDYALVWWLRGESRLTVITDLTGLAPALGLQADDDEEGLAAAVKAALETRQDWLLVFDNATDPAAVLPFMPAGGGHVVITSRTRDWRQLAASLQVGVMTVDEASRLLKVRSGRDDPQAAAQLAEELGALPLALAQAAGYAAAYGTSLASYLDLYRRAAARLLAAGPVPPDYQRTVATTWLLHFEALAQSRPAALDVLYLCSFLAPDAIPLGVLLDTAPLDALPQELAAAAADPVERDAVIGTLAAASLIERPTDSTVAVHRLVQEVTRDQLTTDGKQAWADRAIRLVMRAFPDDPDQPGNWTLAAALIPHGLAAAGQATGQAGPGWKDHADLLNAMAIYLTGRGEASAAKSLFEQALTLKYRGYGPDHPELAVTLDNLGLILTRLGDMKAARELHMTALSIKTAAFGLMHPAVALTLNNLAAAQSAAGDYSAACDSLRQAVTIDQSTWGPGSTQTAATLRDLGIGMTNSGNAESAVEMLERSLAIYDAACGPASPQVAQTAGALAVTLNQLGRYGLARDYLQRALPIIESSYGPDHPETARALVNLGDVLDNLGDYASARAHLQRALAIIEATFGPGHPDAGRILMTLSVVLQNLGEHPQVVKAHRERAVRILRQALGPDHPDTQRAMLGLRDIKDNT
jgi:tetratricopeptide (TPR) repeat protein